MGLFRSRRAKLQRALTENVRLLLPAAPEPDQLLAAARLFSPAAEQLSGNRIAADAERHVILEPPTEIDPDLGRAAQLPPDITVAYFVHLEPGVPLPGRPGDAFSDSYQAMKHRKTAAIRAQAYCFINGLATHFGGIADPVPTVADEPLHADVYTAPRPGPADDHAADGSDPFTVVTDVIKPSGRGLHALTVRAAEPARGADPDLARALGRVALGLAADTDGVCMDVFGFRVLRPEDLIIRVA